jgi:hypothetical protein
MGENVSSFEGSGVERTGEAQSTVGAVKSDPCYSKAYHSPSFKWIRVRVCLHDFFAFRFGWAASVPCP